MKLYVWIFLLAGFAFRASAQELNLLDAFGEDDVTPTPKPPAKPPKKTPEDELDLSDALGPDPKTEKPKIVRPNDGGTGGGTFGDDDLFDLSQNEGYKPDAGKGGQGGGRIADPSGGGGASQPQEKPGQIAGIVSAIGVALIGAASGYIAYQKKKLCFKMQGGDPERGVNTQRGNQSESNVLSNLLRIS
ncbi:CD99 molecule isoform X2 [Paramormyrops kingsleyae]|uniref:CD99 molecule isoform X2 n=1 Tax=Paramormyrops kingsleyae TaxID=1676925 RepID=UPI000CD618F6|nr:CD99 antigen-like protein 2 isoform X2 [Paramormyrops kingsleyae]